MFFNVCIVMRCRYLQYLFAHTLRWQSRKCVLGNCSQGYRGTWSLLWGNQWGSRQKSITAQQSSSAWLAQEAKKRQQRRWRLYSPISLPTSHGSRETGNFHLISSSLNRTQYNTTHSTPPSRPSAPRSACTVPYSSCMVHQFIEKLRLHLHLASAPASAPSRNMAISF